MSSRFAPNNFQYNTRVSLALLPCLVILAGFGGSVSICIGMVSATHRKLCQRGGCIFHKKCSYRSVNTRASPQVGSMVIYILDALQHREAALIAVWLSLGLMNMSFGLTALFFTDTRSIMMPILTAFMNGITLFLTGGHPCRSTFVLCMTTLLTSHSHTNMQ